MRKFVPFLLLATLFIQCTTKNGDQKKADLIIENGTTFLPTGETALVSIIVNDGKISAVETDGTAAWKASKTIDATGQFVMPGFIEGHGHFSGLGNNLQNLDLLSTSSWAEVLKAVEDKVANTEKGIWILLPMQKPWN